MPLPDPLPFWKMHGTGNDFVLVEVDAAAASDGVWAALARRVCDRHFGVGADGLILVLESTLADFRMRIFNPDGSEPEMCGNGIRCFVKYCLDRGLIDRDTATAEGRPLTVETDAGILEAHATFNALGDVTHVRVSMGVPALAPGDLGAQIEQAPPVLDLPVEAAGERLDVTLVSMGNPHAVTFIDSPSTPSSAALENYDLERIGPAVEHHALFANRTNFEVVRVRDRSHLEMRVWERGVGATLACGTGACAAVVASRLHNYVDGDVEVRLPGGPLRIEWDGSGPVYLSGPATFVFASEWTGASWEGPAL